jgi:hypothetical protein
MGSHLAPKAKVQVNLWLTWTFFVAGAGFEPATPLGRPPVVTCLCQQLLNLDYLCPDLRKRIADGSTTAHPL